MVQLKMQLSVKFWETGATLILKDSGIVNGKLISKALPGHQHQHHSINLKATPLVILSITIFIYYGNGINDLEDLDGNIHS